MRMILTDKGLDFTHYNTDIVILNNLFKGFENAMILEFHTDIWGINEGDV